MDWRARFYQNAGGAVVHLEWWVIGVAPEVARLMPPETGGKPCTDADGNALAPGNDAGLKAVKVELKSVAVESRLRTATETRAGSAARATSRTISEMGFTVIDTTPTRDSPQSSLLKLMGALRTRTLPVLKSILEIDGLLSTFVREFGEIAQTFRQFGTTAFVKKQGLCRLSPALGFDRTAVYRCEPTRNLRHDEIARETTVQSLDQLLAFASKARDLAFRRCKSPLRKLTFAILNSRQTGN